MIVAWQRADVVPASSSTRFGAYNSCATQRSDHSQVPRAMKSSPCTPCCVLGVRTAALPVAVLVAKGEVWGLLIENIGDGA